jgi:hypothetical protein
MAALKAIVVGLGLMIVAVAGLIGYELYRRGAGQAEAVFAKAPAHRVAIPEGATVQEMTGAGDRLVLRLALPGGAERLVILDLARGGAPAGSVDLERKP